MFITNIFDESFSPFGFFSCEKESFQFAKGRMNAMPLKMITLFWSRIRPRDGKIVVQRTFRSLESRYGTILGATRIPTFRYPSRFGDPIYLSYELHPRYHGSTIPVQFNANRSIGSPWILFAHTHTHTTQFWVGPVTETSHTLGQLRQPVFQRYWPFQKSNPNAYSLTFWSFSWKLIYYHFWSSSSEDGPKWI